MIQPTTHNPTSNTTAEQNMNSIGISRKRRRPGHGCVGSSLIQHKTCRRATKGTFAFGTALLVLAGSIENSDAFGFVSPISHSQRARYRRYHSPPRVSSLGMSVQSGGMGLAEREKDDSPRPPSPKFANANNVIASAFGLVLASFVTYNLASDDMDLPSMSMDVSNLGATAGAISSGSIAAQNIIDAALPSSATDVVAVALGEGIGGLVGVGSTFVLSELMKATSGAADAAASDILQRNAITEAVAGFDYFLTRAVASPLLLSAGLDPLFASIGSVLVASIPYEIVKIQERSRQRRKTEDQLLNELLSEERERRRQRRRGGSFRLASKQASLTSTVQASPTSVDVATLTPAVSSSEFDLPELVTDVIKWLEYAVLQSQLSGELVSGNGVPLPMWIENGVFGFMAALSSQLYLDALYQNTDLGPDDKSEEARTRSPSQLLSVYATRCIGTAALFSTYESVKVPVKLAITGLISGGYEACLGSEYFDLCVEAFEEQSPSLAAVADAASITAEFRALFTAYASLWSRVFGGEIPTN